MKTLLSPTLALIVLGFGVTQGHGQNQMKLDVLPVTEIRSIDDLFLLQVRITNQSSEIVLVPIPVKGEALGLEVNLTAPKSWVKKKPAHSDNPGITVITRTVSYNALQIAPGATQQLTLDLRDYFEVIDLQQRDFDINVIILATAGSSKANPNGTAYPGSWRGRLSLAVKDVKGVTVRM